MPPINPILRKKDYPLNYPTEITDIIQSMSFTKGEDVSIVGSMSLKSQQYAGDYDMIETVNTHYKSNTTAVNNLVKRFQVIIANLLQKENLYIGDIKAGVIEEWRIIPENATIKNGKVVGLDLQILKSKVDDLVESGIITKQEGGSIFGKNIFSKNRPPSQISTIQFLELQKMLKFHIVRWTPKDVLEGKVNLRGGRVYTLQEAFTSPSIVKLDVIAYIQNNRYTDFSLIYLLKNNGKPLNNVDMSKEVESIKMDLEAYYMAGNYFKALKRLFSLARKMNDTTLIETLNTILNSDLGRLYSVLSDIGTLQYLLENEGHLSMDRIKYELDQFKGRLANVYTVPSSDKVLDSLQEIQDLPRSAEGRKILIESLTDIEKRLETILSDGTKQMATDLKVYPLAKKYKL